MAPFLEPDMVGYIVPYMEPPVSSSTMLDPHNSGAGAAGAWPTVLEAAEWRDWRFHIWYNIFHHVWSQNGAAIDIPSKRIIGPNGTGAHTRLVETN